MTEHLPECPVIALLIKGNTVAAGSCICARLRACEERMLDAAEAAVARAQDGLTYEEVKKGSDGITERNRVYTMLALHRDRAISAIRALKEKP